ncbi:methylmalonyl-CoA mutase subunit beta [Bacillus sp. FJAT-45066]|uniref:methylmalonyl-CoA mutase subunit beta n=1 Tax=Bacillus sp. FJAT-45066 TaxID=2011010 RepID=UPI001596C4F4|nr:methylmalonyl-CoA mutase subunit beta [Bacillus sp. FJAT-45066]
MDTTNFPNMKNSSFPNATKEEWIAKVEQTLKGKLVDSLNSRTYEAIVRQPLYTEAPNTTPLPQTINNNSWLVSQTLQPQSTLKETNEQIKGELHYGLQAINFYTYPSTNQNAITITKVEELEQVLDGIDITNVPLHVHTGTNSKHFLEILLNYTKEPQLLSGYIGADPIGTLAANGEVPDLPTQLDEMAETIKLCQNNNLNVKTIWIDSQPYHNAGANAVQELAISVTTAVEYISQLQKRGLTPEEIANQIVFTFSIGSDFFMEIAKLRAAKIIWSNIQKEFGLNQTPMTIHARTSKFNKSFLDQHVNMLRTTTEAFAAAIGGVDSLNIDSFANANDAFSRRIARNTHYILKEESFLDKVVDPASGSYYIETLTHELAEITWAYFQEIESEGGILASLKSSSIQNDIKMIADLKLQDVKNRKKKLVGVNMYANIQENIFSEKKDTNTRTNKTTIQPLKAIHLAEPFEQLRLQAKEFEKRTGQLPEAMLINIGELKDHKPRTDFATSFLYVGGVNTSSSPSLTTQDTVKDWLQSNQEISKVVIICGSDTTYDEMLTNTVKEVKAALPSTYIIVAGNRKDEVALMGAGVHDFIHLRSNCYTQLVAIQEVLEVITDEA